MLSAAGPFTSAVAQAAAPAAAHALAPRCCSGVYAARQARTISWRCAGLHVSISAVFELGYTVSSVGLG